jgi:hypothetical protein
VRSQCVEQAWLPVPNQSEKAEFSRESKNNTNEKKSNKMIRKITKMYECLTKDNEEVI